MTVLGKVLLARGTKHEPRAGEDFHVRLRAAGTPEVRLAVESGQAHLELTRDNVDEPDDDGGNGRSPEAAILAFRWAPFR